MARLKNPILPTALLGATMILGPAPGHSQPTFDHSVFDDLLRQNVTQEGLVDYDAFAESPSFQRYLASLSEARLDGMSDEERLAFWINAYNAYTIELINKHEERKSIRNINKTLGLFRGKGPWGEPLAEAAGQTWTLDQIEHEIIRVRFAEPRIHFALVCAAVGCPPLRNGAFTGARLDEQLDDQTRKFLLENSEKNRVDAAAGVVYLSPIFDWYRDDFPPGADGLGRYLAPFFPAGPERDLLEAGRFKTEFTDYDWSLNAKRDSVR
jgi:hypothetical protein